MTFDLFGMEIHIRQETLAVIVIVLMLGSGALGYVISRNDGAIIIDTGEGQAGIISNGTLNDSEKINEDKINEPREEIKVYVVGCVKNPGVVILDKGQIISDAINAAGGATEDADLENINLVYVLNRNVMLRIRSKRESKKNNDISEAGPGVEMVYGSGGTVAKYVENSNDISLININTASLNQLEKLPGIGAQTAKKIINYRNNEGSFKMKEDIMKVSGIKENKFSAVKDLITVDEH